MRWYSISGLLAVASAGLLVACGDAGSPAELTTTAAGSHDGMHPAMNLVAAGNDPFTVRAPLQPFRILENPDFMIQSRAESDLIMQLSTFAPGAGPWHTHPGPTFVIVAAGQIKLQRFTPKDGCTETQVYNVGDGYFESANEVHRAVVVSAESAILHVARFIPRGAAISTPAANPGC